MSESRLRATVQVDKEDEAVTCYHKYGIPDQKRHPIVELLEFNHFWPKVEYFGESVGEVENQRDGKEQEGPLDPDQRFLLLA